MLTPRSYLLFFRYFNFVLVVLRQFWYQSKHRSVEASPQERARKYHQKKKPDFEANQKPLVQNPQSSFQIPCNHKERKNHVKTHRQPRLTTVEIDPPAAEIHRPALSRRRPISHRRRHHLHLQLPSLRTSTTTDAKTQDIAPPLLYDPSRRCLPCLRAATAVDP